jgi:signal transduction histidine kinase/DNA-binding response OmpR family regulator
MQVLLVDDDIENCQALSEVLKGAGHSVKTASDGYEALEVIEKNDFDVVISDALMPRMDGFVLCRNLRSKEQYRNLPVIILTGEYTDDSDIKFAMGVGVTKVLKKSANPDELLLFLSKLKEERWGETASVEIPEGAFLKEYNAALVRRLEAKMAELEAVNRKLIERNVQLEREKKKYRQLFVSANDGILLVSQCDGTVVESNVHARKILKLTEKALSQKKLGDLKPFGELLLDKINQGENVQFESSYEQNEAKVFLDISGASIGTEDNLYLIILRNVTRRREWLERFIALDKLRALGRLSYGIVHEIGNPLNVVSVNLQLLDRGFEPNSPEKKLAESALAGIKSIEKVLRETMSFAQPQAPSKSKLQLRQLLSEVATLAKTSLQKYKISLDVKQDTMEDAVYADKSQLLHAVLNIVQNSIEAMPTGGNLTLKLERSDEKNEVVLKIIDTGIGMDDDAAKLAIEPFYTTKEGASGMGLSIANRLLELNDANLTLDSKVNAGTTVTIHFSSHVQQQQEMGR